jgi:ABC-type branched-subunit amino acid transport system substrate-binding protein
VTAAQGRIGTALAVLAAMVAVAACGSEDGGVGRKQLDLKIGALLPRTGYLSQFAPSGQQAGDLALDEIRKAAAKVGARHKVTIIYGDDKSQPATGVEAATKMADQGTGCLVGSWGASVTERVMAQIAAPKKILQISPAASGDAVTKADDRGYLFRTVPPDRMQAHALAELLDDELGGARGKKVNVGALESTYGKDLVAEFDDAWSGKGGQIGETETYRGDQPTYAEDSKKLGSGKPDAWVFFDFDNSYARVTSDLQAHKGYRFATRKAFGTDSLATPRLGSTSPQASNGLRGVAIGAPNKGATADEFERRYKAKGSAERQTFDAQAFDAAVLCYLSAVAAGSSAGVDMKDKVREVSAPPGRKFTWLQLDQAVRALEAGQDIDYEGASGPINLNDAGDPTAGVYDVYEFKSGKLRTGSRQIAIPVQAGGI